MQVPTAIIKEDEQVQEEEEDGEEGEEDRPHLEPKGTLSFTESQIGYEEMVSRFENVQQLNHCWLRGLAPESDKDNANASQEGEPPVPYDDVATICLEMNYQQYV